MSTKLIQIIEAPENMYLMYKGEDEKGHWETEEKVISLGLQSDESIILIIVSLEGRIEYVDADREIGENGKIIFK